jgi:hypothetical protein
MRILKRASLWIWVFVRSRVGEQICGSGRQVAVKCPCRDQRLPPVPQRITDLSPSAPASSQHHAHPDLTFTMQIQISGTHSQGTRVFIAPIPLAARTTRCSIYLLLRTHPHDPSCALCSQPSAHAQITPSQICPSADMGKRVGLCKCHCCAC